LIPAVVAVFTIGGAIAAMATGSRAGAAAGFAGLAGGYVDALEMMGASADVEGGQAAV